MTPDASPVLRDARPAERPHARARGARPPRRPPSRSAATCGSRTSTRDATERTYACLHRDAHLDVWAIFWLPENDTGWHDHDTSSGAVHVVAGALEEHALLVAAPERRTGYGAGAAFTFGPSHIHRLTCAAPARRLDPHLLPAALAARAVHGRPGGCVAPGLGELRGRAAPARRRGASRRRVTIYIDLVVVCGRRAAGSGKIPALITLKDVTKQYPDGTVAVGNLDLEIPSGEITVLLGSSGCGKTTTLRMINRLIEPTSGEIELDGRNLLAMPVHELRRGIGYVIQQAGLFPHRTVADNIATVPRLLGWDKQRQRKRALELIELVGLEQNMADRYPSQLSGGQQQRVGVARALAADPPVLLMDEPFGAVDPVRRGALQQEFRRLQQELGKTVVFVTHDVDEAVLLGDRIAIMQEGGKVAQYGPPEALLAQPADEFVASFIGGTRGIKLLSLRSGRRRAGQRRSARTASAAGRCAATTATARSRGCAPDGPDVPVERVGPAGTLRDLLDSAIASPARAAVRVDEHGVLLGAVAFDTLEEHLPAPQRAAAEA